MIHSSFEEYMKSIKKVTGPRKATTTNAYNRKDYYNNYRKVKPDDPRYNLGIAEFYNIIQLVNSKIVDSLLSGNQIRLPSGMGTIRVSRKKLGIARENGKMKVTYPIDWKKTMQLWYEDEEARMNKTIVRDVDAADMKIRYDKNNVKYVNKSYFTIRINRDVLVRLNRLRSEGKIDALYK